MPKLGDKVSVTIKGHAVLSGTLTLGEGASMTVPGTIIEDRGDSWLIELAISDAGRNRIIVAKSAYQNQETRS